MLLEIFDSGLEIVNVVFERTKADIAVVAE